MTREEAIDRLKEARAGHKEFLSVETLNMAIQALSQEPCDDAVSRRKAISVISACDGKSAQIEALEKLPSVTPSCDKCAMNGSGSKYCDNCKPSRHKGHWIKSRDCYGNNHFTCSECGHDIATQYADSWNDKYCSECGAEMESSDERDSD